MSKLCFEAEKKGLSCVNEGGSNHAFSTLKVIWLGVLTRRFDDLSPKDLISGGAVSLLSRWRKQSDDDVLQWLMEKFSEELDADMDALLADVAEGLDISESASDSCEGEEESSRVFESNEGKTCKKCFEKNRL